MLLHQPQLLLEQKLVWKMILSSECEVASTETGFSIWVLSGHSQLDLQPAAAPTAGFSHTWIDSLSGFQLLLTEELINQTMQNQ
jgi:hypothetical protein